jgi:hypothetical protein
MARARPTVASITSGGFRLGFGEYAVGSEPIDGSSVGVFLSGWL